MNFHPKDKVESLSGAFVGRVIEVDDNDPDLPILVRWTKGLPRPTEGWYSPDAIRTIVVPNQARLD